MGTEAQNLVAAAADDDVDQLGQLIAAMQSPEEAMVQELLTTAAWKSSTSVIEFLLNKYAPFSVEEETVRAGVYSGSVPLFSLLLFKYPSIINMQFDKRGTPLMVACSSQQPIAFLKFLLDAGADPNQDPDFMPLPLALVAAFHDTEATRMMIEYGAKLEHSGALSAAALMNNEAVVLYLLEHGASHNTDPPLSGRSMPALHAAARKGHFRIVKMLLEHGADAKEKDEAGQTAAQIAKNAENVEAKDLSKVLKLLEN